MSKYGVADINKQVRSQGNLNRLEDLTPIFQRTQKQPTLLSFLFNPTEQFMTTNVFQHDYKTRNNVSAVGDAPYNERGEFVDKETVQTFLYQIPHFPLQGSVRIEDYLNVRQPGTANEYDTEARLVGTEMSEMDKAYTLLDERAFAHILTTGTAYRPNGTVPAEDFYENYTGTAAGSRPTVNFDFADADFVAQTAGVMATKMIRDNSNDGFSSGGYIAICGSEFFQDRITDPDEQSVYIRRSELEQDPLVRRLADFFQDYRMYRGADNILYIEYDGTVGGSDLIAAGDAYIMPMNISQQMIRAYAPAHHRDYVNSRALPTYAWRLEDDWEGIRLMRESNFLDVLQNPGVIIRATSTRRS